MSPGIKRILLCLACLMVVVSSTGCAGRNYLLVDYQVPPASDALQGRAVQLQIEDQRPSTSIMTPDAAYQFPEFSGVYSLAWIMPDQQRILAGEHQLIELFRTVFTKRLTELGVNPTDSNGSGAPILTIILKQFTLDLQDRKWKANLNYEAVLSLKNHPTARENIHGSAERVRVIGRKGADTVLSEIFSDAVNRLDLLKLFNNAGVIQ